MEAEKPSTGELPAEKQPSRKWVKRILLLPLRILVAVLLVAYVLIGMDAARAVYKRFIYGGQDISSLDTNLDTAAQSGDYSIVLDWVRSRPLAETDKLIAIISPKSAPLGADIFFELFRRERVLDHPEEALFWMQMGRFRLIYDIIRCGGEAEDVKVFAPAFAHMHSEATDNFLRAHPEALKKTAQRVLDFDTKYPAHNDPAYTCKAVVPKGLPADEINWEGYHQMLRKHTEEFVEHPDRLPGKAKAPAGKK